MGNYRFSVFLKRYWRLLVAIGLPILALCLSLGIQKLPIFDKFLINASNGSQSTIITDIQLFGLLFASLSTGLVSYIWMDYKQHKRQFIAELEFTRYTTLHHLKFVSLPLIRHRKKELGYWLGEGTLTVLTAAVAVGLLSSQIAYATAPALTTQGADSITATTAELNATINSSGSSSLAVRGFEYGLTASYGSFVSDTTADSYEYSLHWGSTGSGNGQFNLPEGLARDSLGNAYVVDNSNHRIQKFSSTGTYLAQWGTFGFGGNNFNYPHAIAIDSNDKVYVADTSNNRVSMFNTSGVFQGSIGSFGTGNGQMIAPSGVVVDSLGNIYVADTLNNRIQKFNSSGVYVSKWGISGNGDGQFQTPYTIDVDNLDNIYVADRSNNRIQKFNSNGTFLLKWGSSGTGNGQFSNPAGVALDANDFVYVSDSNNHRIQKFTSNGVFVTKYGSQGTGTSQLSYPVEFFSDDVGGVFIADSGNHRIVKITPVMGIGDYSLPITGLTCATTYHYRAFSTNATETGYGADATFTTASCGTPVVTTQDASSIATVFALLNGTIVDTGTSNVTARGFQYGLTPSYGTQIDQTGGAPYSVGSYSALNTSLTCATTYYMRAYATNSSGTVYGNEESFTTSSCPIAPTVNSDSSSNIARESVSLQGTIVDVGSSLVYARGFEYGPTISYGQNVTETDVSFSAGTFSLNIYDLSCGTTYHYRAFASGYDGFGNGSDDTFSTASCAVSPTVDTLDATSIGSTSATLNGSMLSLGSAPLINQGFEVGENTSYGWSSYAQSSITGDYSLQINSLTCETTYHFRAAAYGVDGAGFSEDKIFTTGECPEISEGQTDISISQVLLSPKPIVNGQQVVFRLTIKNNGPNVHQLNGVLLNSLPAEFSYSAAAPTNRINCNDLIATQSEGAEVVRTLYGNNSFLNCQVSGATLEANQSVSIDISGIASSDFINGTRNRVFYFDLSGSEPESYTTYQQTILERRDVFLIGTNNVSQYTYVYDPSAGLPSNNPEVSTESLASIDADQSKEEGIQGIAKNIIRVITSIPTPILAAFPIVLLFSLLGLAILYCYRAWREYKTLQTLKQAVVRLQRTKEAIDNYLSITSHHINTPTAILNNGLELLVSLKEISSDEVAVLLNEVKRLEKNAQSLIANAANLPAKVENEALIIQQAVQLATKSQWRSFWFPTVVLVSISAVINFMLLRSDRFSQPGFRIGLEIFIVLLAIGLFMVSLRSRKRVQLARDAIDSTIHTEQELLAGRQQFIADAIESLASDQHSISNRSANLRKSKHAKAFLNGLDMLTSIITTMQNVQKVSKVQPNPEPYIEVGQILQEIVTKHTIVAEKNNVKIVATIPSTIRLSMDAAEFKQLVSSLLDNAMRFNKDAQPITIQVKVNKRSTTIVVTDKGIGIPKDRMESLLQPFSRATGIMQYDYEGLGLNLYVDRLIVEKAGGRLNLDSHKDKGTKVTVSLPNPG